MATFKQRLRPLAALTAPVLFSFIEGHFLSALGARPISRTGKPLPWYTYGALHELAQHDLSSCDVLEFGGGQSTKYFDARARSVVTMETNPVWIRDISKDISPRTTIHHVTSPEEAAQLVGDRQFDIISVDDTSIPFDSPDPHKNKGRARNGETAFAHIRPSGFIIVDNSGADFSAPICEAGYQLGFARMDFFGWAPSSFRPYFTSIFFPNGPEFLRKPHPPISSLDGGGTIIAR